MTARVIIEDGVSDYYGLAGDEMLAHNAGVKNSAPVLRLYSYASHQVLVGRFQTVENEVHLDFCRRKGISVNRRPTGGGTILMGEDQLGVALALPGRTGDTYSRARQLMAHFSAGVTEGLRLCGIHSCFRHKNDVEADGKKIAGLGIYRDPGGGLLFHASVLVDMDIPLMLSALRTPFEKISDKEIRAVSERITTVSRLSSGRLSFDDVRRAVLDGFSRIFETRFQSSSFNKDELEDIKKLTEEKYSKNEWIYQRGAVRDSNVSARIKTKAGLLQIDLALSGPTIKAVYIRGDFFASEAGIANLEAALRWHSANPVKLGRTLYAVWEENKH